MAAIEHLKQVITKFKDVPFSIEFVETADTYNCQATIDNCDMLIQVDASIVNIVIKRIMLLQAISI